jgi:hypothetical protein
VQDYKKFHIHLCINAIRPIAQCRKKFQLEFVGQDGAQLPGQPEMGV